MARRPFFSGNYGSALGSTANAANLIARAGETQGQMFANMGQQIGGMIQQYGLNKEKQKKNQAFIKGQNNLLDMLSEQDPEQADRYAIMKEQLNNPDVSLTERTELGKQLMQNVTYSNQMQNQMLNRKTQEQALGLAKKLEESQVTIANLKAEIAGKTKDDVIEGVASGARAKKSEANMAEVDESYQKDLIKKDLDNKQSLIDYRNAATLGMVLKQNGINAPVPQDLEKRFSEISTQLDRIDNSKIKVKTSGLLGGEEKEITFGEFNENPDNFAPVTSDRIKALQANKDRLIQEQTEGIFDVKIPAFDQETGESILITLRQKMEYDEARRKKKEEEEQALRQANQINVRSQFQGVRN